MTDARAETRLQIRIIPVTPLQQNCSLIWDTQTKHAVLVDPGGDTDTLMGALEHFGLPAMDEGPIIVQASVPVLPGDDAERLAARILEFEHAIYPLALRLVAEGAVTLEGERVVRRDGAPSASGLVNPSQG